jgi:hypothetical protein
MLTIIVGGGLVVLSYNVFALLGGFGVRTGVVYMSMIMSGFELS